MSALVSWFEKKISCCWVNSMLQFLLLWDLNGIIVQFFYDCIPRVKTLVNWYFLSIMTKQDSLTSVIFVLCNGKLRIWSNQKFESPKHIIVCNKFHFTYVTFLTTMKKWKGSWSREVSVRVDMKQFWNGNVSEKKCSKENDIKS